MKPFHLAIGIALLSGCSGGDFEAESAAPGAANVASAAQPVDEAVASSSEALTASSNCDANYRACYRPCAEQYNHDLGVTLCLSCINRIQATFRACVDACAYQLYRCQERQ